MILGMTSATSQDASLRLVSVERLSRVTDGSTGIERQDEGNERYAQAYGHKIVAHAPDTDVSGNVPMWERPKAGPFVNDTALQLSYDAFIFSNLDRLGRNARHISAMRDWAEDHGKKLIITNPPLSWPPAENDLASPIIWDVLSRLAEYELKAITRRNRETQAWLKANGFLVGKSSYGYKIVPKGDSKTLEPDENLVEYVESIFRLRIEGKTLLEIAQWLDSQGALTQADLTALAKGKVPEDRKWNRHTVQQIIENPIYKGTRVDGKGNVVLTVTPIVDAATWRKAQMVNDDIRKAQNGRKSDDKALLAGSIKCGVCGRNMSRIYSDGKRLPDGTRERVPYYYCHGSDNDNKRCGLTVNLADADAYIAAQVAGFGNEPHMVPVLKPSGVYLDEIEAVTREINSLDQDDDDYDTKHAALRAERKRFVELQKKADEDQHIGFEFSGKTVGQEWARRDPDGKRAFLLEKGCELSVVRVPVEGQRNGRVEYSIGWRNWWNGNQPKNA
jgi:DNA invertase Pin-like site-specific DNA recombinase